MDAPSVILLAAVCLLAAWTDARARVVPNWLTAGAVVSGFLVNPTLGAVWGLLVALALTLPFFFLGYTGGGDVKLFAAIGAILGWQAFLVLYLVQAILGGLVAAVVSLLSPQTKTIPRAVVVAAAAAILILAKYR